MQSIFSERRSQLSEKVLEDSAIIISSASVKSRISDTEYAYRQDSNFYYLSGYEEPESLLLIRPDHDKEKFVMFCRERDPLREQWDGFRTGQQGAIEQYGADAAHSINSISQMMPSLLEGVKNIYFSMSAPCGVDLKISDWIESIRKNTRAGAEPPQNLLSLDSILHEMRLIKEDYEMNLMRQAANITTEAHVRAMQAVTPGMFEYQLEAEYLYAFNKNGARSPAYNSIVGGGNNSCILHYVENNAELQDGDLVLVDAGCEYQYYASDVTRTFPVNGKFSSEQKLIYEIVLESQKQSIESISEKSNPLETHKKSLEVIVEGLLSLGLLKGSKEEVIETQSYSKFYMHRVGHWLGLDVHDVGGYEKDGKVRSYENGMITTIEPGIYISNEENVPEKFKGIGIRIEDDVLVENNQPKVLSSAIKELDDIQQLMAS